MSQGGYRSRWVRAWAGTGLAVALAAASLTPAGAAQAGAAQAGAAQAGAIADAPGTVDVNRIPSRQPEIVVLGASPAGVLYRVRRSMGEAQSGSTYLKPAGKPAHQVSDEFEYLAGDKIYVPWGDVTKYLVIGSTTVRTCPTTPRPAPARDGAAFTPFGWISRTNQKVTADVNGCRITGSVAPIGDAELAASDASGYVTIDSVDQDGRATLSYHSYATPDKTQPIQTGGRNRYVHAMELAGSVVTWAENDHEDGGIDKEHAFIVRSSTTGGPAKVTEVQRYVNTTAIIGTATAWAGCITSSARRCAAGSISSTGVVTEVPDSRSVASDGTRFFVDTNGSIPGIHSATVVDGKNWTRLVTIGLLPPYTYSVDAAAGHVTYVDDQAQSGGETRLVLARRSFTKSGDMLTLGAQRVAGNVGQQQVTRDGDRTAYMDDAGVLWIATDGGTKTRVFTSQQGVSVAWTQWPAPFTLSGHRLLWVRGDYVGTDCELGGCDLSAGNVRLMMFDLRTGKNVDLGPTTLRRPAALWGNYLVTTDATNRILRKDLSSGVTVQVKAAGPVVAGLDVNGTIVGWSTCAPISDSDGCGVSKIGYKVVSSTAPAVELTSQYSAKVSLTGGHLAYTLDSSGTYTLKTWRLGTTSTTVIGRAYGFAETVPFEAYDETLAWIGVDRTARLTPLAPFVARPRYLGNASVAASFNPSAGQRWAPSFPISKALPTCAITIKSGSTVKRSLPCATSTGIARAVWDGKDAAGQFVAKGAYAWTLTASDSDGGLLWWNGSANPISGIITVA